jgi:hypothetical protein
VTSAPGAVSIATMSPAIGARIGKAPLLRPVPVRSARSKEGEPPLGRGERGARLSLDVLRFDEAPLGDRPFAAQRLEALTLALGLRDVHRGARARQIERAFDRRHRDAARGSR